MSKKGDGTLAWLRDRNRQRVVGVLRERGRLSQAEIARVTGLSRTTVHSLVAELKGWAMVQEVDAVQPDARGGRPAIQLVLRDASQAVLHKPWSEAAAGFAELRRLIRIEIYTPVSGRP